MFAKKLESMTLMKSSGCVNNDSFQLNSLETVESGEMAICYILSYFA